MAAPGFLHASLLVALGGGTGAWLRFAAGRLVPTAQFPFATLAVNLLGSLAMGLLAGWLVRSGQASESWRLAIGVGLLGGFTTFSAFSLDLVELAQRGQWAHAILYAALSLAGGVAGLLAGLALARTLA
jgi:CrcB protein